MVLLRGHLTFSRYTALTHTHTHAHTYTHARTHTNTYIHHTHTHTHRYAKPNSKNYYKTTSHLTNYSVNKYDKEFEHTDDP